MSYQCLGERATNQAISIYTTFRKLKIKKSKTFNTMFTFSVFYIVYGLHSELNTCMPQQPSFGSITFWLPQVGGAQHPGTTADP